jgi:amino acid adenylation domain-containing protein/non-ribosomal peptide synthase protein (TIGR01720 family)
MSDDRQPESATPFDAKRARLAQLLSARAAAARPPSAAVRTVPQGPAPLSFPQQRLWLFDQLEPGSAAYIIGFGLRLTGPLNLPALDRAIDAIVARHDVLRATFSAVDGNPGQAIGIASPIALAVEDVAVPEGDPGRADLRRLVEEECRRPFDLVRGPVFRARLFRVGPADHLLTVALHHIVSDAWSVRVFVRELAAFYEAAVKGVDPGIAPLPVQYADFARWQHETLRGDQIDSQIAYWRQQLEGAAPSLELPADRPRPARQTFRGGLESTTLTPETSDALRTFGRREGATLSMTMLAAFQLLLARLTGETDIVVGSPTTGRTRADVDGLIGCFLNTLVLRTRLDGDPTFTELVRRARATSLGAYAHQDVPFERLVEALQPPRSLDRTPVFQVLFNMLGPERLRFAAGDLQVEFIQPDEDAAKFDLTLYVVEGEHSLAFRAVYNADLFDGMRIAAMLQQLEQLLIDATSRPDSPISELSLVTGGARGVLPDPAAPLERTPLPTVPELILRRAREAPEAPALDQDGVVVTYGTLALRARTVASQLRAAGVARGDVVAVTGRPGIDCIVGMIAVFLSRGVLLTLDRRLPAERQRLMLDEARAAHVLHVGDSREQDEWLWRAGRPVTQLASDSESVRDDELVGDRADFPDDADAAYIFFTSGTTGVPKAVLGVHRGLSHFVIWQQTEFGIGPGDRHSQLTGLSFDVVLREIFTPLTSGATLCLRADSDAEELGADRILPWMERAGITVLHTVPTLAQAWLADVPAGVHLRSLRRVFFAGEPLTAVLVRRWRDAFQGTGEIINLYGPTETTLAKCFWRVADDCGGGIQPVGRPMPQTQALVIRDGTHLCGIAEVGEIAIRTPYRTLGYANAPDETRRRFIANPFTSDADDVLYLTGDRGRYRLDGVLEILGREDDQVKIRGARIELGEVTAALCRHPLVRQGVVSAREGRNGEKRLVAYAVVAGNDEATAAAILRSLQGSLPDYMAPSAVVLLDRLPVTANGKLDRSKLPEPLSRADAARPPVPPRTPLEAELDVIWREVLGLSVADVHQDFFEAGGHSLLAMQLVSRIRTAFRIEMPLRVVYEHPTIAALAGRIEALLRGGAAPAQEPITHVPRDGDLPVSSGQQRLWFIDRLQPDRATYNVALGLRLEGRLDAEALEQAFNDVIKRHDSLRASFDGSSGRLVQHVSAFEPYSVPLVDASAPAEGRRDAEVLRLARAEADRPFDLARGPLYRAAIIRRAPEDHVLVVVLHHIVSDVWSMGVLFREVALAYTGRVSGRPAALPDLPIQYADYADWQHRWLQSKDYASQLAYWKGVLQEPLPVVDLATDRQRPEVQTFRGSRRAFRLAPELSEGITTLARREGVTPFTVLLAAYNALLHRYTGQQDIVVGFPVAGRSRAELEPLIGFFVNTLPLRTRVAGDASFTELMQRVHDASLGAFAHQEMPFDALVTELQPDRDMSRNPIFQVAFALHNTPMAPEGLHGLIPSLMPVLTERARFDLLIAMWPANGSFEGVVEYSTDLFNEEGAARVAEHYTTLLESAVERADRCVSALPILARGERQSLAMDLNPRETEYPRGTIQAVFEEQAERTPDALAIVCGAEAITYHELNCRANRLAHRLRRAGVRPDGRVAVCLDRSPSLIVALLGILKAGGAYVPLDAGSPPDRLAFMLEDIDSTVLITERAQLQRLPGTGAQVLCLEDAQDDIAHESDANPEVSNGSEHLAYVCYTSGSTGVPKGVEVPHRGVLRLLFGVDYVQLGPAERILVLAPVSFDASTFEIWGALLHGGCCVVFPESMPTPDALRRVLREQGVTTLWLTSSLFNGIVDHAAGALSSVRQLLTGGEALSIAHVRRAYERLPLTQLVNGYGPTESTTFACCHRIPRDLAADATSVPIGRPIGNTQVYILDASGQLAPTGVPGELYIGGDGVARGYMNRPDLTAERFVPDPFSRVAGARLYRTGDLVRWRTDRTLEFLGRLDAQVKVRGFRIELGEIDAVLRSHPAVRESAVIVREDTPGDKRVVAYVVSAADPVASHELRTYLKSKLPDYMIPAAIVSIETLPLNPNGKLDRRALPAPDRNRPAGLTALPAASDLERTLAAIWREELGVSEVGVQDNFFDLGGHSLLLVEVHRRLREASGLDVPVVDLFRFPTIRSLCEHLGDAPKETAAIVPAATPAAAHRRDDAIAIVGIAGRFPKARSVPEFWTNLCAGLEAISFFTDHELVTEGLDPAVVRKPGYVKARAVLEDIELFDATFFGYSAREAAIIDPQQRLFLECAWEALEDAGYDPERFSGTIGVYAGVGPNTYAPRVFAAPGLSDFYGVQLAVSSEKDFLPTRVSYKLNLKGPSLNIQTACSTSLVAVHVACRSLLDGECDMALAGGVRVTVPQTSGYQYQSGGIMSPDGHCRAFDAGAAGTVSGNGAGVVVLKRLADALADGDPIYAVVKGSAINNDGSLKVGYTAPSVEGQAEVIVRAHARAGVDAASISYVEAHGTGTSLGDPIEIAALTQAFRAQTTEAGFCAIGSLKTNVGHLDAAAGVAGLIKAALALKHRQLPPSLHFEQANPQIPFDGSPFYVNTRLAEWPEGGTPRRAGVSSFGLGGTNAHVVLEEAPAVGGSGPSREAHLIVLSARSASALDAASRNLADYLVRVPDANLADVAYTLQVGRRQFNHRRFVVCRDAADAIGALSAPASPGLSAIENRSRRPVAFMFTGQGAQRVNMARGLYETEPLFRERLDECAALLQDHLGFDLRSVLFPSAQDEDDAAARLLRTAVAQPALFAVEYSLAKLWMAWGVAPQAMIGHSLGEYVAACLAGVMGLPHALALVAARGRLMQALPPGGMLSVPLDAAQVDRLLGADLSIAAINAPASSVVSGTLDAIARLWERLAAQGVECRTLHTSHAFHSSMMDPILAEFQSAVRRVPLSAPSLPFISNLTGGWITAAQATSAEYWVKHLRQTVRFHEGLETLVRDSAPVLLEVGPGRTLTSLSRAVARAAGTEPVASLDADGVLHAVGQLWLAGVTIDGTVLPGERRRRVAGLPTYPFERERYWIDAAAPRGAEPAEGRLPIDRWFSTPAWTSATASAEAADVQDGAWLVFGDERSVGDSVAAAVERRGGTAIRVIASDAFASPAAGVYGVRPGERADYVGLLETLARAGLQPRRIVHAWAAEEGDVPERGFFSLLPLMQAVGQCLSGVPLEITVVTAGAHDVTGAERLNPAAAMALGAVRVVPLEYPNISCIAVDVDRQDEADADLVVREASARTDRIVALRAGRRWVQTFRPVRLDAPQGVPARLRPRGVYLITGGTGGIGIELARYLARTLRARLTLIGRTDLPSPERRGDWTARHGADDRVSRLIAEIASLEALGAEVLYVQADAADSGAMTRARDAAVERFGPLNGVIHAAGAEKIPCAVHETDRQRCDAQFRPRVAALHVIESVFGGLPLDFIALQSSLSSVLGAAGFLPYTAAHLFMDAYALRMNRTGRTPWIVANWDNWTTWKSGPTLRNDETRAGMTADEAVDAFGRIVACPAGAQIVVSTQDLDARTIRIGQETGRDAAEPGPVPTALHARPALRSTYAAPTTDAERALLDIWQDLLGIGGIGIDDNFFELGGDSVTSIQVVARAAARGVRITTRQAFELPTIAELAAMAMGGDKRGVKQEIAAGPVPLTPIQRWFFEQKIADPHHFNQAVLLEVDRAFDLELLEEAARTVAARHDALRLRYRKARGAWQQSADRTAGVEVLSVDLSHVSSVELRDAIEQSAAEAQAALDLSRGPLMTLTWMDLGPNRAARLLIVAHHLVIDAISWGVLLEELYLALDQSGSGRPIRLPPVTTPFQAWARALSEHASSPDLVGEVDYWTSQSWHRASPLPADGRSQSNTVASSFRLSSSLTADETNTLLHEGAASHDAHPQELLLAALHQTFAGWTGGGPLHVHLEGHGRDGLVEGVDLSRTVGWFTTIYPVLLDVPRGAAPGDAVTAVKRQLRAVPNGGIGYGVLKYLTPDSAVRRQMIGIPDAEISFLYMGRGDQASPATAWMRSASEPIGQMRSLRGRRPHAIDVIATVVRGELQVTWTFSEALHHRSRVEALSQGFLDALRGIIAARPGTATLAAEDFPAARLEQDDLDRLLSTIRIGGTN